MKHFKQNLFLIIVAMSMGIGILITACEGPTGPAGTNGTNGTNGTAVCKVCHGDADVELKFAQYNISIHGEGDVYAEEAGRPQCGACHSGDGFAEAVALGQNDAKTTATSRIGCYA